MRLISIISLVLLSFQPASAAPVPVPADALVVTEASNLVVYKDSIGAPGAHQQLLKELREAPPNPTLYIESPGGSIAQGMDVIELVKARGDVTCVAPFAASMAFAIMQSCKIRISSGIMPYWMQHTPQIILQGQKSLTELEQILEQFLKPMAKVLAELQAPRLGLTVAQFNEKIKNEWNLIGKDQILANKAADEHRTVVCTPGAIKKKRTVIVVTPSIFGSKVDKVEASFCPLIPTPSPEHPDK